MPKLRSFFHFSQLFSFLAAGSLLFIHSKPAFAKIGSADLQSINSAFSFEYPITNENFKVILQYCSGKKHQRKEFVFVGKKISLNPCQYIAYAKPNSDFIAQGAEAILAGSSENIDELKQFVDSMVWYKMDFERRDELLPILRDRYLSEPIIRHFVRALVSYTLQKKYSNRLIKFPEVRKHLHELIKFFNQSPLATSVFLAKGTQEKILESLVKRWFEVCLEDPSPDGDLKEIVIRQKAAIVGRFLTFFQYNSLDKLGDTESRHDFGDLLPRLIQNKLVSIVDKDTSLSSAHEQSYAIINSFNKCLLNNSVVSQCVSIDKILKSVLETIIESSQIRNRRSTLKRYFELFSSEQFNAEAEYFRQIEKKSVEVQAVMRAQYEEIRKLLQPQQKSPSGAVWQSYFVPPLNQSTSSSSDVSESVVSPDDSEPGALEPGTLAEEPAAKRRRVELEDGEIGVEERTEERVEDQRVGVGVEADQPSGMCNLGCLISRDISDLSEAQAKDYDECILNYLSYFPESEVCTLNNQKVLSLSVALETRGNSGLFNRMIESNQVHFDQLCGEGRTVRESLFDYLVENKKWDSLQYVLLSPQFTGSELRPHYLHKLVALIGNATFSPDWLGKFARLKGFEPLSVDPTFVASSETLQDYALIRKNLVTALARQDKWEVLESFLDKQIQSSSMMTESLGNLVELYSNQLCSSQKFNQLVLYTVGVDSAERSNFDFHAVEPLLTGLKKSILDSLITSKSWDTLAMLLGDRTYIQDAEAKKYVNQVFLDAIRLGNTETLLALKNKRLIDRRGSLSNQVEMPRSNRANY